MNDLGKAILVDMLQMIVRTLALIDTEELQHHIESVKRNNRNFHDLGPFIDPTAWLKARSSGQMDDAEFQLKMAEKLLEIRKLIDEREAFVAKINGGG